VKAVVLSGGEGNDTLIGGTAGDSLYSSEDGDPADHDVLKGMAGGDGIDAADDDALDEIDGGGGRRRRLLTGRPRPERNPRGRLRPDSEGGGTA
jgi:hypothetical protein